jgi:hypothetical protein
VPLTGLRNQKGRRGEEDVYGDGSMGKDKFVFNYYLPLEDCDEKSTKDKIKRED